MGAPRLFGLSFLAFFLGIAGCGESFTATTGGGGDGGGGKGNGGGDGGSVTSTGAVGGAGGATGAQGGGGEGPLCDVPAGDECTQCLVKHCEGALCGCLGSAACKNLGVCIQQAGPEPQFTDYEYCWQQNKGGIALAGELQACGFQKCGECDYAPVSECQACQYQLCGDKLSACLGDYKCTAFLLCLDMCGDGDFECIQACSTQHPAGQQLAQSVEMCAKDLCDVCN